MLTAGGIVGHIIDIDGDRVTLETSVGASFVVLKPYVLRKLEDPGSSGIDEDDGYDDEGEHDEDDEHDEHGGDDDADHEGQTEDSDESTDDQPDPAERNGPDAVPPRRR